MLDSRRAKLLLANYGKTGECEFARNGVLELTLRPKPIDDGVGLRSAQVFLEACGLFGRPDYLLSV